MTPARRDLLGLSAGGFHRLSYLDWNPDGRAGTVICVHGLTRNGRDFDDVAADLAGRGHRVICPDVVGRGGSDRLADPAGYAYPQYLADAAALIARLDVEQVDWLGTSMGGLVGMMLAAQQKTPIRRLIVNDVGPFIPKAALERIASYVGGDPVFADFAGAEAFVRTNYGSFGRFDDAGWRKLTEVTVVKDSDGNYRLNYDPAIAIPFRQAEPEDVDLWPVWDAVSCPTLVLRGVDSDLLLTETAQDMTRRGPAAKLVTFDDCGHAPALMEPNQIAAVGDWLDG